MPSKKKSKGSNDSGHQSSQPQGPKQQHGQQQQQQQQQESQKQAKGREQTPSKQGQDQQKPRQQSEQQQQRSQEQAQNPQQQHQQPQEQRQQQGQHGPQKQAQGKEQKPSKQKQNQKKPPKPSKQQQQHGRKHAEKPEQSLDQQLERFPLAKKPSEPGTLGEEVRIVTNCFEMSFPPFTAHQHKLVISSRPRTQAGDEPRPFKPLTIRRDLKRAFERFLTLDEGLGKASIAFDGKDLLWSFAGPLGDQSGGQLVNSDFALEEGDEVKEWKLELRNVANAVPVHHSGGPMTPESVQIINTALNYLCGRNMVSKGSNIFDPRNITLTVANWKGVNGPIGPNLALLGGCFKSARQGAKGPQLMVDWAATLIEKGGPLGTVFATIISRGASTLINAPIDERGLRQILGELKGLAVRQTVGVVGRKLKISAFGRTPFVETFDYKGERITVARYFATNYKYELENEFLPCLKTQSGSLIPCEICHLLPNQIYDKKLNEVVQANMTKLTIIPPQLRMTRTLEAVENLSRVAGSMNINGHAPKIILTPIETDARILPPPEIDNIKEDRYIFDLKRFADSKPLSNWSAIQIVIGNGPKRFDQNLFSALGKLVQFAQDKMNWKTFEFLKAENCYTLNFGFRAGPLQIEPVLRATIDQICAKKSNFTFWVFPSGNNDIYKFVKYMCNQRSISSQCLNVNMSDRPEFLQKKLEKLTNPTFLKNLLLKMNVKNGGTNAPLKQPCLPKLLKGNVMVVGMDVYHPGVGEKEKPSIAGFVASYDTDFLRYTPIVKIQPRTGSEEVIDQVEPAMVKFLQIYKEKNGKFPSSILFYRDGVSEGQLEKVMHLEVNQITQAYKRLSIPEGSIKLTHITVQKRHKFRMYTVQRSRDGKPEYGKPKPGTVVDQDVVDANRFEYYLNSHDALIGTSKPSHQTVIVNEHDLGYDDLEQASYYLSWLSARCCKPISVPVPANYAHLVAERANILFEAARNHPATSKKINQILADLQRRRQATGGARATLPVDDRDFLDGVIRLNLDSQMAFA